MTSAIGSGEWVINWTKLHGGGPSSLYSWSISHILKHDFFCLGHFVSNTYPEKMPKLFMDGRYTITEVLLTRAKHFKITRSILGPLGENNESFRALLI